jgi:hypothetical protein
VRRAATTLAKLGQSRMSSYGQRSAIDGLAGGLGLGDLVVELGELVPSEPLPVVERDGP